MTAPTTWTPYRAANAPKASWSVTIVRAVAGTDAMHRAITASRACRRRSYASAARAKAAALGRSARVSATRIRRTAYSALRGSCHQCGSARAKGRPAPTSTTVAEPPAFSTTSPIHASTSPPLRSTTSASATACTSCGRGSYSCGSVFGRSSRVSAMRSPPTCRAKSASWVVVATTRTRPSSLEPAVPHPATLTATPTAAAAAAARRGPSARTTAASANTAPDSAAIAGPGGALSCTDAHRPIAPSTTTSATAAACHAGMRPTSSRVVAAGTTTSAVASSAPAIRRAATAASATSASSTASGTGERSPCARAASGSKPCASQRRPSASVPSAGGTPAAAPRARSAGPGGGGAAGRGGEREVAGPGEERRAEGERVDARRRVEDVARQDHAGRERPHEDERGDAVLVPALAPSKRADRRRDGRRGAERTRERRDAEPGGKHEPGERRRADRVGVEREAAQDDPGAEKPRGDGQGEDLEEAALDERQAERLEHRGSAYQSDENESCSPWTALKPAARRRARPRSRR